MQLMIDGLAMIFSRYKISDSGFISPKISWYSQIFGINSRQKSGRK
jgi:hypothetical protein